jgi:hypothetical protein
MNSCRVPTAVPSRACGLNADERSRWPVLGSRRDLTTTATTARPPAPPSSLDPGAFRRSRSPIPSTVRRAAAVHRRRRAGAAGPDRRLPGDAAALVEPRANPDQPVRPNPAQADAEAEAAGKPVAQRARHGQLVLQGGRELMRQRVSGGLYAAAGRRSASATGAAGP